MTLIVGDRVKLITDRWKDDRYNPIYKGSQGIVIGTVVEGTKMITPELPITVNWDNGEVNGYTEANLAIVQKHCVRLVKGVKYIKLCTHCKKEMEETEVLFGTDEKCLCKDCNAKLYVVCSECKQIMLKDTGRIKDEEVYCEDCYTKLYIPCDECNTPILREDGIEYEDKIYCNPCFNEEYFTCSQCGETILRDNSYIHNDEMYCENCYEEITSNAGAILDHDYKPEPIFSKQQWENTTYLGIELELECEAEKSSKDLAESLKDKFGTDDFFYLKEDGSLTNGFEIVTHPHTLQKHRERKWRDILTWLKQQGATSYENEHCGLHIHVDKKSLSNLEWYKIAVFFYKCQSYIISFSKRTRTQVDEWAEFCSPKSICEANNAPVVYHDRYEAVNWDNRDTVEFRIFRGTLDWRRFWASLTFTASLLDYVRETGVAHFTTKDGEELWTHFRNWTKRDYQFLYNYLKEAK